MTNMSLKPATLFKKRLCHRYFPVNFAKFLKTPFLQDTSWRLLLWIASAGVIYHGKCNYYVLINCARHSVRRKSIQNHFKIFNFLLIWDKNLWSRTGWPVAKPSNNQQHSTPELPYSSTVESKTHLGNFARVH